MAKNEGQIVIKKYANRRLYNTGTSTYVTLEDLAEMVKKGEDFTVQDAKSGDDITHSVLTQIIFEQESKTGNTLLPISFLRQLITYYGDQMQMVVPSFLEHSMRAFTEQQSQMREQMTRAFGETPLTKNLQLPMQMVEEQVRRNTELFQQAMQMFSPFMTPPAKESRKAEAKDIDELKKQLRALQNKLDNLYASEPDRNIAPRSADRHSEAADDVDERDRHQDEEDLRRRVLDEKKLDQESDENQHRQHVIDQAARPVPGRLQDLEEQQHQRHDDEQIAERHTPDRAGNHRENNDVMLERRKTAGPHEPKHRQIVKYKWNNHQRHGSDHVAKSPSNPGIVP